MTDYRGVNWRVNFGEISEIDQFRVGYTESTSYAAYFPVGQLTDLINVLTGSLGLALTAVFKGGDLQTRKLTDGVIETVYVEPRLDSGRPAQIMTMRLAEVPDLLFALNLFLSDQANNPVPDDWDNSVNFLIEEETRKIREVRLPGRLSQESLENEFAGAADVTAIEETIDEGRLSEAGLSAVYERVVSVSADMAHADVQARINTLVPGDRLLFLGGTYAPTSSYTLPVDRVTVDASRARFNWAIWQRPIFDLIGRSDITLDIQYAEYVGVRSGMGTTYRGSSGYVSTCVVWANRDRIRVRTLSSKNMPVPVFFSSWDGTGSTDRIGVDNVIGDVHVEGFNFGVLWAGQKNLVIENLTGNGDIDDSAGVNPTHLIYGSATHLFRDSGVRIISAYAENITKGHAYQWKYSDRLEANITAYNCSGLLSVIDSHDMLVTGRITESLEITVAGADASVYIASTNVRSQRPVLNLDVQLAAGVSDRTHLIICDDGDLTLKGRSAHTTGWNVSLGEINIRGDRNRLQGPVSIQTGTPSGVGILVQGALNTFINEPIIKGATIGVSAILASAGTVVRRSPSVQTTGTNFATTDGTSSLSLTGGERELNPYQFGAVAPVNGSDNTAALTAMFAAANSGIYAPAVYIPEGIWIAKGVAFASWNMTAGLTVRGAGQSRTRLSLSTGATVPMFRWSANISGVSFSDMRIESITSIWEPASTGGLYGSIFRNLFLFAVLDTSRIYYQANASSFIHNTFEHIEMQRTATSTVIPFHIIDSAGAANFNEFNQVRMNGLNNPNTPFLMIETSMPGTYLTDWTFINILGEQNPAGLIHSKAAYNWTLINVTDEDSGIQYNNDIIRFDANAAGLAPRDITIMNCGRRGQSMASGKFEIFIHANAASGILIQNCNPTPVSGTAKISAPLYADIRGTRGYPQQLQGAGSPEGAVNAVVGSTFFRTDGGAGTSLYVKESGSALTGWVAK